MENVRNDGLIRLNPDDPAGRPRTLIVTGSARSGTSMVARLLVLAGVDMGSARDDVVFEDADVVDALGDPAALSRLVGERDGRARVWGFKRPHLFAQVGPEIVQAFRSPRFVVTFRDPAAIAQRNALSEFFDERLALREAAEDMLRCMHFALGLAAPVLLVSYEKALGRPDVFVGALMQFCGLKVRPSVRARMEGAVEPDQPDYARVARRRFEGHVDLIAAGVLHGWCREVGVEAPLAVEVTIDDGPAGEVLADVVRPDLAATGSGYVCHGFNLDVSDRIRTGREQVRVRVLGRSFELTGSGRSAAELSVAG